MGGLDAGPGALVAGRYRLESPLGEGGFGAVFRATDLAGGQKVALKVLLRGAVDMGPRFRREAELAMRLSHPNTVRTLDAGEDPALGPYIALELLEGQSLEMRLRTQGALAPRRVAEIALAVLASLEEAHGRGIIHRDIKPANVFLVLSPAPTVKVLDFGIAKSTNADTRAGLTREGQTIGTPAFMAPEQVTGGALGPETDLYAVGLLVAESIAGRSLYEGREPMSVLIDKLEGKPVPIPDVVRATTLGPVVERAVAHEREARWRDAASMREAIEEAVRRMPDETFSPSDLRAAIDAAAAPEWSAEHGAAVGWAPTLGAPGPATATRTTAPPIPAMGPPMNQAAPGRRGPRSSGLLGGCLVGLGIVTAFVAVGIVAAIALLDLEMPRRPRRDRPPPARATAAAASPADAPAAPVAPSPPRAARAVPCPRLRRLAPSSLNQSVRSAGWVVTSQSEMVGEVTRIAMGLARDGADVGHLVFHDGPAPHDVLAELRADAPYDVVWSIAGDRLLVVSTLVDPSSLLAAIC